MKYYRTCFIIGLLSVFLFSCSSYKAKSSNDLNQLLVGKWQVCGESGSNGFQSYISKSRDSLKYFKFKKNGSVSGTYFKKAVQYKINDKRKLSIVTQKSTMNFFYTLKKDTLHIQPDPFTCDEGCSTVFIRKR